MASNRIDRANSKLQKALQEIISFQMNDPRITPFVGVNDVKVAPDFRYAKVKIALTDGDYSKANEVIKVLRKSQGFIKAKLGEMLDLPYMPKLDFVFDNNMQNAIRVEELLKGLVIPPAEEEEDDDRGTEEE